MASDNQLNYSVNKLSKYTKLDISQGDFRQFLKDAPSTNTLRSSSVVMGWITLIPLQASPDWSEVLSIDLRS